MKPVTIGRVWVEWHVYARRYESRTCPICGETAVDHWRGRREGLCWINRTGAARSIRDSVITGGCSRATADQLREIRETGVVL